MARTHANSPNQPGSNAAPEATFRGQAVLVVGLGRFGGGVGVTRWLAEQGARVTVTDRDSAENLRESIDAIADLEVDLHLGGHDLADLDAADLVIINPAIPKLRSDFFQAVTSRNIPWTTELNLFCERCQGRVIGITGTYGKSTTCTMLANALRAADGSNGGHVYLGGNIGRSLLCELTHIESNDIVVLEMSNAQLEDISKIPWTPSLAIITNLSPHHLERYNSYEEYLDAKLNIVGSLTLVDSVLIGHVDEVASRRIATRFGDNHDRFKRILPPTVPLPLRLRGAHNQENAALVLAACRELGIAESSVLRSIASFAGLPHRMEYVGTIDGVEYINDSKSTAPLATITTLKALRHSSDEHSEPRTSVRADSQTPSGTRQSLTRPEPVESTSSRSIVLIVGGQSKNVTLDDLCATIARQCRVAVCVGETGPKIARGLQAADQDDQLDISETKTVDEAVIAAAKAAKPGDTVLFSPGAQSFDAFGNFTQRGRCFVEAVRRLA